MNSIYSLYYTKDYFRSTKYNILDNISNKLIIVIK